MAKLNLTHLIPSARRAVDRMGWPGAAGIGLLVFCGAAYLSSVVPAQAGLEQARRRALALKSRTAQAGKYTDNTPANQLATFYKFFPSGVSEPDWLEKIYQAAADQNLTLSEGDYRTTRERVGKLTRCQVTLPVKGSYPEIRKFLAAVLSDVPIVSLDGVDFSRQKVGDPAIEAKIRFSLFLRSA